MRLHRARFGTAVVAAVLVPLLGLSACGSDDKDDDSGTSSETPAGESSDEATDETVEEPTETPTAEETESESAEETPAADGAQPTWALPVTRPGDVIASETVGDVRVEIYQVGREKATDDGNFVDPDTNKPILKKGDELVFVNYVITNNGEPIRLGSSRVSISAKYDDWPWLQGMDGDLEDSLWEAQQVNKDELAPGAFDETGVYLFQTGQTYSYGDNFGYQKNSPITFDVTITPVDPEGELIHDERMEKEIKATIK